MPTPHRLTADEYHRIGEARILPPDARVELIAGEIVDMAPIGSRHAGTVERLARSLNRAADGFLVRAQQPVQLGEDSEPVPDIAVVRARADDYLGRHPTAADVFLIIEVSDTSLHYDHEVKAPLYASHGIPRCGSSISCIAKSCGADSCIAEPMDRAK